MSKKRKHKNTWARTWVNQTELGHEFGLSAIAVGKHLTALGLKDGPMATERALADGYAVSAPLKDGTPNFRWHRERCIGLLLESGLRRVERSVVANARRDAEARRIANEIDRLLAAGEDKMASLYFDTLDPELAARVEAVRLKSITRGKAAKS
jgi:hypothetical protein